MSASMSSSPRASMIVTPWSPIGPETSTASPGRTAAAPSCTGRVDHADAGGVDVAAVGLAALHHLGVAGDDLAPRPPRPPRPSRRRSRRRSATGKPSSRMKPADRYSGRAPRHGQVVDRAVDGEVADVAAGEEQRRHHVRVGGEGQPAPPTRHSAAPSSSGASAGCGTPRGTPPRSGCASPCRRRRGPA